MEIQKNQRLQSLDILRGLDIFILVFAGKFLKELATVCSFPCSDFIKTQLTHVDWVGFHFWDLVMPLFMFMAGVSMPFSLAKYTGSGIYWRIIKRVILLFFFGALVQGNILLLRIDALRFYSNTLQAIAVGYLIASIIMLNFKIKWQVVATSVIFIVYYVLMTLFGDFTPDGNFAETVDRAVLGRWRDGVSWNNGVWKFADWYHYTWVISSLNFGVTVMLGAFAGEIMRSGKNKLQNAKRMFIVAISLIAFGWLVGFHFPIIKKIWSSSLTLYSGGWCFLLMTFFYWYIDCLGRGKWLDWLKIYGMNSIAAYMISSLVDFRSIPLSLFKGLKQYMGEYYTLFINFWQYAIIFFILYLLYKNKKFLKV